MYNKNNGRIRILRIRIIIKCLPEELVFIEVFFLEGPDTTGCKSRNPESSQSIE